MTLVARESDITKERIAKILAAGTNVVLTTGGIDDLCLKYFIEAGCMGVRRCKKEDLKRIARATGGQTKLQCYCCLSSRGFFVFMLLSPYSYFDGLTGQP